MQVQRNDRAVATPQAEMVASARRQRMMSVVAYEVRIQPVSRSATPRR